MGQRIVAEGLGRIGHIHEDRLGLPMLRDAIIGDAFDEIAVRVDQGAATAGVNVLPEQGFDQGRLADAGLADEIHVREPISLLDAECPVRRPGVGLGEVGDGVGIKQHRPSVSDWPATPSSRHMPIAHVVTSGTGRSRR